MAIFCPLVVFVGGVRIAGVRSRCPCSGVWLLLTGFNVVQLIAQEQRVISVKRWRRLVDGN